ncbi:uncharacterized protein [Drosophila bipectinata]|uniref:uncharacterized protein n=1 Tax=Drosophila bipectinata TaxID=42026 RepID=UPI001C8A41C4|nr:tripartite motif-containing protein 3 [Drosophila bipectinata]
MVKRRQIKKGSSGGHQIGDGDYDLCAICQDRIRVPEKLQCSHVFCRCCLANYREARGWVAERCPICRRILVVGATFNKESDDQRWLFGFVLLVLLILSLGPFYLLLLYW